MSLLLFFILLVVYSLLATVVFSFLMMPVIGLMVVGSRVRVLAYPIMGIAVLVQLYFWGLWAALCSVQASNWAADSSVPFLYYLMALFAVSSPIMNMARKEMSGQSARAAQGIMTGSVFYGLFAVVAYLVFSIWPVVRQGAYGGMVW